MVRIFGVCDFARDHGLVISKEKTVVLPISRSHTTESHIDLSLEGAKLKVVSDYKFLGVTLDKRLTYKAHVKQLVSVARCRLGMLKCLSGTYWGCSAIRLNLFYKAFVLSKLMYGNEGLSAASDTALRELEKVQSAALRLISGTPPSTSREKLRSLLRRPTIAESLKVNLSVLYTKMAYIEPTHPLHSRMQTQA